MASPELFLVNPMTAFDLAVLLGPARSDIPMANTRRLYGQRERQRELGSVVPSDEEVKAEQVLL